MGRWLPVPQTSVWGLSSPQAQASRLGLIPLSPDCSFSQCSSPALWAGGPRASWNLAGQAGVAGVPGQKGPEAKEG